MARKCFNLKKVISIVRGDQNGSHLGIIKENFLKKLPCNNKHSKLIEKKLKNQLLL